MRRDGVDYIRCLDCDQVFEADDLELEPVVADDEEENDLRNRHPHHHQQRKAS